MASTAAPYGLRPVKLVGNRPFNNGFSQYSIASAYGTTIFQGDVVKLMTGGVIEKATNTNDAPTNGILGVFMGVSYTDSDMGFVQKNMWTADTVASDAMAYVVDDPDVIYEIQADSTLTIAAIGAKGELVQTAGNTSTGISKVALNATVNTTATFPLSVVGYVDKVGFSEIGDAFTDMLVRINLPTNRHETGI